MPEIMFFTDSHGILRARWPGRSKYVKGAGSRKEGQRHLGLVINKENLIFWNRAQGYFRFDPITESCFPADPEYIPDATSFQPDGCRDPTPPVYIDFGDSFFLDQLIRSTGYDEVINTIPFSNRDTLYSMIQFYALEGKASTQAATWYRSSYASYLYPKANLSSQRISDFLHAIGTPEVRRAFLIAHIKFVLESTDEQLCVLIDSTGMPNACDIPVTCISNHEGDVNIEFRMIAIVQKRSGIPLYYQIIAGNIVDITTLEHTITKVGEYGLRVDYVIGDAGYCCPGVVERLLLHGVEFMSRVAPQYKLFKKAVEENLSKLDNPRSAVKFNGRCVRIFKFQKEIVKDTETGEMKSCFIYLCRDEASFHSKSKHLYTSTKALEMTSDELIEASSRMGLFAIITTKDIPVEDLLPEYYIRQNIEQYFDFGKNYGNYLPIRKHNMLSVNGHLLIGFIATFLVVVIKNRLNIVDTRYVCVPPKVYRSAPEGAVEVAWETLNDLGEEEVIFVKQDPLQDIFSESPSSLFLSMRGLKAEVFNKFIQPDVAQKDQREYLEAFGLANPTHVNRLSGQLVTVYKTEPKGLTKLLAFTYASQLTDEEIVLKRKAKADMQAKKAEKATSKDATETTAEKAEPKSEKAKEAEPEKTEQPPGEKADAGVPGKLASADGDQQKKHRGGRKPGSKNKKTLEREAAIARGEIPPPKPKRPYHRRNKPQTSSD